MKNTLYITLLVITTILNKLCIAQQSNNDKLKLIYQELVTALKSENDQDLRLFCYNIAASEEILNFMRQNGICYKGIPCKMDEKKLDINAIGDMYYLSLVGIRNRLKRENLLNELKLVDTVVYKTEKEIVQVYLHQQTKQPVSEFDYLRLKNQIQNIEKLIEIKTYEFEGTETDIVLQSRNKIIRYPIGEMIFIKNKWSLFSRPNTSYRIVELNK